MNKMNIAVLFGSRSCEHDVSIISALQLIEAARTAGFGVTPIYISRDGIWYTGDALLNVETFRDFNPMGKGVTRINLIRSTVEPDLERDFLRRLVKLGLEGTVDSNER